ncbi:MAG: DUF1572 family protein [Opitutus sp.]
MTEEYLSMTLREFKRLQRLAEDALAQLPAEAFFSAPAPGDNSLAVIVKHVGGNLLSRWTDFLSSDGEKPNRDRDAEFLILADDSRERLMDQWNRGWAALFDALSPLQAADLNRTVTIRGEQLSVLQAINRQLTHYAYHVGQIVYVAKHFAGAQWTSLSIPVGASKQFNQAPAKYVTKV